MSTNLLRTALLGAVTGVIAVGMAPGVARAAVPACVETTPLQRPIEYDSTDILPDGRVTFRLCAPQATAAKLVSSEIEAVPAGYDGKPEGLPMAKDELGYWSVTTPTPVAPGPYRYGFKVDGIRVADPQVTHYSQFFRGVISTIDIPGTSAAFESFHADVPHGLVSTLDYWSKSLGMQRRAHIYTPPGYEAGKGAHLPVLYLVHGAGDSDDSWTSIGHAQYILDNLIAAGKAKPMIIVMPFGHTPAREGVERMNNTDFGADLLGDLVPYVDAHFRTAPKPAKRAMAGLSMGGAHTLQFGLPHPEVFGAIGVFSVGLLGDDPLPAYGAAHGDGLKKRGEAHGLVYYAIGKADPFRKLVEPTEKMFDQYGIKYEFHESEGGHTWQNWRDYLVLFAPKLFQ
ncbi:MAG: alpha/beta hydrolase-fold protein [Azospirillaceae bacterium]|nr:alpha/beta hydrolase-fold protein [Azospirillaceae bacterium]